MVDSILGALRRIKADVAAHLQASTIERLCQELDYVWRERTLGPVVTIHAFLMQVLHANTACDHVSHLMGRRFTGEAYAQARARLPLALFERLLSVVCQSLQSCRDEAERWCGLRVWLLDGSGCSMSDTDELQKAFGQPGGRPGCGFPVAHLLTLFHATTGMLQKVIVSPLRTHDLKHASQMHPELAPGDVLVGDRGFCSFAHLAQLVAAGFHGVMRIHQRMIVDFHIGRMHIPPSPPFPKLKGAKGLPRSRWVKWLGHCDHIVEWYKPKQRPKWLDKEAYAALPSSLLVRELRFHIERPGFRVHEVTLVTTLLDPQLYPAEELAQLYFDRWRIEVNLRHLKQTLGLDVLRCLTEAGVRKEICMLALVYNLVRLVMLKAANQQEVEPDRISFIDALRWLTTAQPNENVPPLIVNARRQRVEPRVKKRRPKQFPLMKRPRAELRQALLSQ
jgi:Transposase DDE domain